MSAPEVRGAIEAIGLHPMAISIEFAARSQLRRSVPRRNELHKQANPQRGQDPIWPDDLRSRSGLSVLTSLLQKTAFIENSKAPKAWPAG